MRRLWLGAVLASGCAISDGPAGRCVTDDDCRPDFVCRLDGGCGAARCETGEQLACATDAGHRGVRSCAAGAFGPCAPTPCGLTMGVCLGRFLSVLEDGGACTAVSYGPLYATADVCGDLEDNDCDGRIDETEPEDGGQACPNQAGVCLGSMRRCSDAPGQCSEATYAAHAAAQGRLHQPFEQACDGQDNDCDGEVDISPTRVLATGVRGLALSAGPAGDGGSPWRFAATLAGDEVVSQLLGADLSPIGMRPVLGVMAPSTQLHEPALAATASGRWVVAWATGANAVQLRRIEPDGTLSLSTGLLSDAGNLVDRPQLVALDQRVVATWRTDGGDVHLFPFDPATLPSTETRCLDGEETCFRQFLRDHLAGNDYALDWFELGPSGGKQALFSVSPVIAPDAPFLGLLWDSLDLPPAPDAGLLRLDGGATHLATFLANPGITNAVGGIFLAVSGLTPRGLLCAASGPNQVQLNWYIPTATGLSAKAEGQQLPRFDQGALGVFGELRDGGVPGRALFVERAGARIVGAVEGQTALLELSDAGVGRPALAWSPRLPHHLAAAWVERLADGGTEARARLFCAPE